MVPPIILAPAFKISSQKGRIVHGPEEYQGTDESGHGGERPLAPEGPGAAAALGAGVSRTVFASDLPVLFIAGVLCLVAALAALTIARRTPALQVAA